MRLTRKNLRHLIETTIKPTIPNVPNEDFLGKIDTLSRNNDTRHDADSFAGAFGYPENRSYVEDLTSYDNAGRLTFDTPLITVSQDRQQKVEQVPIPPKLVDEVIRCYERIVDLENQGLDPYDLGNDAHKFRDAGYAISDHIDEYLDNKYGEFGYELDTYGFQGNHGYRGEELTKAMGHFGEYA